MVLQHFGLYIRVYILVGADSQFYFCARMLMLMLMLMRVCVCDFMPVHV